MAQLDFGSLATSGLSGAVAGGVVHKLNMFYPGGSMGNILSYAVPFAAGVAGAFIAANPGRMSHDIGQGVQAGGFALLGYHLSQKWIP